MVAGITEIAIPLDDLTVTHRVTGTIALVGNPNSGKSTLFNRLTGMRQRTANYPGVTVEKKTGKAVLADAAFDLVDLPGTYALSPHSTDERIAVDVLLGRMPGTPKPDAILAVVDATRLYQGLFLLQQLAELGQPLMVALTMTDVVRQEGIEIDTGRLQDCLGGVPIYPVVATTGRGFPALEGALGDLLTTRPPRADMFWPELRQAARKLRAELGPAAASLPLVEIERALIGSDPRAIEHLDSALGESSAPRLEAARRDLCGVEPPLAAESRQRYRWVQQTLSEVQTAASTLTRRGSALVNWLNRPWPSTVLFLVAMAVVFQAVFSWATPFMDLIDAGMAGLGDWLGGLLPSGMVTSFLVDGVIAGVGSVIIFLPQILILFLFILLMEDSGYLARAAFLADRVMRPLGLSGQSVIPLLSSFACAVPAIMAARVIPNRRDQIATILAAPFMTCSARLPVYALLIAAFVPNQSVGVFNLQGLVLLGLYLLGIAGGAGTAMLLRSSALRGAKPTFILALPEFRLPNAQTVIIKLLDRVRIFLRRAGTVIFAVAVVVWALAYFPRSEAVEAEQHAARTEAAATMTGVALEERYAQIDNEASADHLSQSLLGRAGQFVAPVFHPLGWDWRVSAAVIAGFPAREVVVAVMGTIYAVGDEADEASLAGRLRSATWPDGRSVFTLPMVLGLLIFYAWCLQCAATLAVIRRETNSWRWPIFAWSYMTTLGYLAALAIYQTGTAWS